MQLDSETFDQIVGGEVIQYTSDGGRRQTPRAQSMAKARLVHHKRERQVEVNEISRMGASLDSQMPIVPGEHVIVRFDLADGKEVSLICAVRHCLQEDEVFHVGVEYVRVMEQPSAAGRQMT